MIAAREQHKQVSKVAAAGIAQPSHILDTGKRIIRVVAYRELALSYGAGDKRAGSFSLNHQGFFIATDLNWFVGIVTHMESSKICP